jgi:hypothetical protein
MKRREKESVDEGIRNGNFSEDGSSKIDVNNWSVRRKKTRPLWLDLTSTWPPLVLVLVWVLGPEASVLCYAGGGGCCTEKGCRWGRWSFSSLQEQSSSQIQKRLAPPLMGLSNHPSPSALRSIHF